MGAFGQSIANASMTPYTAAEAPIRALAWKKRLRASSTQAADQIELQELPIAPLRFKWGTKEEEDKHVPDQMRQVAVQEHVREAGPTA